MPVLWMKSVTSQRQASKGLHPSDQRRFPVEWANQSQDYAADVFESEIHLANLLNIKYKNFGIV